MEIRSYRYIKRISHLISQYSYKKYDQKLLDIFNIKENWLPKILASDAYFGMYQQKIIKKIFQYMPFVAINKQHYLRNVDKHHQV